MSDKQIVRVCQKKKKQIVRERRTTTNYYSWGYNESKNQKKYNYNDT